MTKIDALQLVIYLGIVLISVKPLGWYMQQIYAGNIWNKDLRETVLERTIYRYCKIDPTKEMDWKQYLVAVLLLSFAGWLFAYILFRTQSYLPLNPQMFGDVAPDLAFNTAASIISNTGWQAYGGETTMSYLSQSLGLTVQNFVSGAVGMSVLMALMRGIARSETTKLGNFWVDCIRSIFYILLPLALILSIVLVSQGVIQNFSAYQKVNLIDPVVSNDGSAKYTSQTIPMGPVATFVASKQLTSSGVGFFNTNAAHPFENPTPLTNLLGLIALILIPAAFCYTYGLIINKRAHGWVILAAMLLIYIPSACLVINAEQIGNPKLALINLNTQPNFEGKEVRLGITGSSVWTVSTAASANGSVNTMLDSLMPISSLIALVLMHIGEVVFGGVGSGLYRMIFNVMITVFLIGLMVGRTPEYLGKKIEPFEMKMLVLVVLVMPLLILVLSAFACILPAGTRDLTNSGAQGFSEILYAYTSASSNNGSALAGLAANSMFYNITLGATMIINRYWTMIAILAVAGSMGRKKALTSRIFMLSKQSVLFVIIIASVIIFLGGLTFLPTLALGPIVEFLSLWGINAV